MHGANIEDQEENQWTSLYVASYYGHLSVAKVNFLVEIFKKLILFRVLTCVIVSKIKL